MCGITGFMVSKRKETFSLETLSKMTTSIRHRGPDDEGVLYQELASDLVMGLGHRRLSILDLTTLGHQPMHGEGTVISFNGEIYNYLELKSELEGLGFQFQTRTDTEVVLAAYQAWGLDAFARFNGMWAIALFDIQKKQWVLSRDRFGKKPLYYYLNDAGIFAFSSEIKALLTLPVVPKKPNEEKVFRYLSGNYRYVDSDDSSFFEGINQVPKACVFTVSEKFETKQWRYWSLSSQNEEKHKPNDNDAIKTFRDLLVSAVELRLRSDVPVGCFLSGGLDSTSVTCIASKILGQKLQTFSGITGKGIYDESFYVDDVVKYSGGKHTYVLPNPTDLFETIEEMLGFHDEPVCTVTWYNLYLISKEIAKMGIKVVLNGHGGDEVCGGYWDYYQYNFLDMESHNHPALKAEVEAWRENHSRDPGEVDKYRKYALQLKSGETNERNRFPDYCSCFSQDFKRRNDKSQEFSNPFAGWLTRRMYSDLWYETVPPVLRAEDRNTMAFSIESRSPFLDYRIAEYMVSLPSSFKIRNGLGKWLIRESMRDILPESVRTRKDKTGFVAPFDEWVRTKYYSQFQTLIQGKFVKESGWFIPSELTRVLEEHMSGKDHAMFLWQFLNLVQWHERFFKV